MNVEHRRFSLQRLAPVALAALGIFGAMLMIFAGLVALNHSVLPFEGWPLNAQQTGTQRLTLPRAPTETGRLRTGSGGTHAQGIDGRVAILSPAATAVALGSAVPATSDTQPASRPALSGRPQRQRSHSSLPRAPKPVVVQVPVAAPPAPAPAAPAPVALTPVVHGNGNAVGKHKNTQAATTTLTASPSRAPAGVAPQSAPAGPGKGHGKGHAFGHAKHQAPVPAPPAVAAAPPAVGGEDAVPGNGHGPPPWAHGHGKHD